MTTDLRNGDGFDAASSRSTEAVDRHARAARSPSPWRYDPPVAACGSGDGGPDGLEAETGSGRENSRARSSGRTRLF